MVEATVSLQELDQPLVLQSMTIRTCLPATIKATESPFSQKRSRSRVLFFLEPSINHEEI